MIKILVGTPGFPVEALIDLHEAAVRNRLAKAMAADKHGFGFISRDGLPVDLTLDTLARLFTDNEIRNALDRAARFIDWCLANAAGVGGTATPTPRMPAAPFEVAAR